VRCVTLAELDRLVTVALAGIPGVVGTRTSIVLASVKDTPILPLPASHSEPRPQGRSAG
jgi:Lrp/AsnC family leucine-responsive transcriptional regulator